MTTNSGEKDLLIDTNQRLYSKDSIKTFDNQRDNNVTFGEKQFFDQQQAM